MKRLFLLLTFLSATATGFLWSQIPEHYYDSALNKSRGELKEALWQIISDHKKLSYADLWEAYGETDTDENGYIIDMYNECLFEFKTDQCGSGSSGNAQNQCVCYNREHSMPKSWFNDESPMYTDLHHLYPVSGYINSRRNNYPYGEVDSAKFTSTAGSKLGIGYAADTQTVFEPIDEYKGDLARTYFYMATCYHDKIAGWNSPMLSGENRNDFTPWAMELLLEWHRKDPVSSKEENRNNAVYRLQGNRNPFIDHPELIDKIWGDDDTPFIEAANHPEQAEEAFWEKCKIVAHGKFIEIETDGRYFDSIEILQIDGKRISGSNVRQNRFGCTLPVSGIYIVRIQVKNRIFSQKISVI